MTTEIEKTGRVCLGGQIKVGGCRTPYRNFYSGFTLAEALMAIVVLGIAAASLLVPFSSGARLRAEGMHRTLGAKLASHLMERIVRTPFDQIMDDYDGYTESEGQVTNAAGEVITDLNYTKFSREVSCNYVYVAQESGTTDPVFIRVTIRVNWDGENIVTINRLVSE